MRDLDCGERAVYLYFELRRVDCKWCGVKPEHLSFVSPNANYSERFVLSIGKQCRVMAVKDIARLMRLGWDTVKDIDKIYMREQLRRAGPPTPRVIGIDEISIRKRHVYRIVVSDLDQKRAIWFGGDGRSEADIDQFYAFIGNKNAKKIRLAVMDMWKPFRNSTQAHAPNAAILFDKFHVLRHLGDALDKIRKTEYARVTGDKRKFIKGQKYVLLSHRENLTSEGQASLKLLLNANKRLNTAYILRESFDQLWTYNSEAWARKFFDNWKAQLRWQRLEPYEKFAAMIEKHWDGIAAYCQAENKVALGFVEGLNNKIRVIQRRAYGLRDEEYLKLKILTANLPEL
jgi:transposase